MATKKQQHYERNANEGRRVRFSIRMNFNHCTPEDREKMRGTGLGTLSINGGTMNAEDAATLLEIINRNA